MEKFLLSSDECLALVALAKSSSLREAARLLNCDAGGLLRKVQHLAAHFGVVQKVNGRWVLTLEGHALVGWTQENITRQKELLESNLTIKIAATTWFAEQVLIPNATQLKKNNPNLRKVKFVVPEKKFETSLLDADCDFAVVCHPPEDPSIAHSQILDEPWSIIISKVLANKYSIRLHTLKLENLQEVPFINHKDLNPEVFLPKDFKLNLGDYSTNSLIGVRSAVVNNLGWSFVPSALVLKELENNKLIALNSHFKMGRKICVWWARGGHQGKQHSSMICRWAKDACSKI